MNFFKKGKEPNRKMGSIGEPEIQEKKKKMKYTWHEKMLKLTTKLRGIQN